MTVNEVTEYVPGDVANGHRLMPDGQWVPVGPAPGAGDAEESPPARAWYTKKRIIIPAIALAGIAVFSATSGGSSEPTQPTTSTSSTETTSDSTSTETAAQKNAVRAAENYLATDMGFSREGLIEQLEFEGYTTEDATYAVDSLNVDWNEQAAIKAENYLDTMPFSHDALVDQLIFEGFTPEQAEYGVSQAGL